MATTIVHATCARRPRHVSNLLLTHNDYSPSSSSDHRQSARRSNNHVHFLSSTSTSTSSTSGSATTAASIQAAAPDVIRSNSVKYLIAGALAGIVSRTAVSPLEVVATINMCTAGAKPPPILHQLRNLLATEGVRGFFKGNAANCLKVAPTKGIQFVAFEAFKRIIHQSRNSTDSHKPLSAGQRFLAGGMAGIFAASLCYPLDTAKTLLTTHPDQFKGVLSTIASVCKSPGPRALYRGLSPTLIAMMPYAGLDFAIYEQCKIWYANKFEREPDLVTMLFIGAFAGAVAQTACHPLDVLRKRLQLQGVGGRPVQYKSMIDAARGIVRNEGVQTLFRGLQPMYISAIPSAGVSYVVYEVAKRSLGVRSLQ